MRKRAIFTNISDRVQRIFRHFLVQRAARQAQARPSQRNRPLWRRIVLSINIRSNASTIFLQRLAFGRHRQAASRRDQPSASDAIVPAPRGLQHRALGNIDQLAHVSRPRRLQQLRRFLRDTLGASQPYSSANCSDKRVNSVRISSPRWRNGGTVIRRAPSR